MAHPNPNHRVMTSHFNRRVRRIRPNLTRISASRHVRHAAILFRSPALTTPLYPFPPPSFRTELNYMFCRATALIRLHFPNQNHHFFPTTFQLLPANRRVLHFVRSMASGDQTFPPQKQGTQPGKEHVMDPTPQASADDYKPANKLRGKVALVTGGDSGIGRAVCHCFTMEGATVAFTYVKGQEDKDAQDTLGMLKKAKHPDAKDPIAVPADLGYDDNCKRVVDQVVNNFGRIDVLVNNAAEQHEAGSVEEIDEPRLERVFRTNIFSYFFTTRHCLKHMKEGSSIINTTSVNAYKGNASLLDYTATKGAIVAFTRGLALQLANKGIRVNGVAPGPIWTPLIPASFSEEKIANFGKEVPMQRAGQPIEMAPSYVFLASNVDSSYFTGQVLHPNGGTVVNA